MYCTHCGHQNPDDARFCSNCGRPVSSPNDTTTGVLRLDEQEQGERRDSPEEPEDVEELSPGTALLVAVRGSNEGERFLLDRDVVTVGRHPDSDMFLDDITVSRRHAEFHRDGQRFSVKDSGSLNGTYVNGERADEEVLEHGDEVQIGKFRLVVYLPGS